MKNENSRENVTFFTVTRVVVSQDTDYSLFPLHALPSPPFRYTNVHVLHCSMSRFVACGFTLSFMLGKSGKKKTSIHTQKNNLKDTLYRNTNMRVYIQYTHTRTHAHRQN